MAWPHRYTLISYEFPIYSFLYKAVLISEKGSFSWISDAQGPENVALQRCVPNIMAMADKGHSVPFGFPEVPRSLQPGFVQSSQDVLLYMVSSQSQTATSLLLSADCYALSNHFLEIHLSYYCTCIRTTSMTVFISWLQHQHLHTFCWPHGSKLLLWAKINCKKRDHGGVNTSIAKGTQLQQCGRMLIG